MLDNEDSELMVSLFLMDAWDAVAGVEEGVSHLAAGDPVSLGEKEVASLTARGAGLEPAEARP